MIWRDWNKADKTLLCAAAVFLFSLCLRLQYPENIFAKGFLFCAEAALVGGIADWFAVTALFRKPLGITYRTEILRRNRKRIMDAMYPYLVSNVACGIDLHMAPWVYAVLYLACMLIYAIIHALLVRRIRQIPANEILKARE